MGSGCGVAAFVVLVAIMVQHSLQLRCTHPMHDAVDRINSQAGPYIGLVVAFPLELVPLQASALFVPDPILPLVNLSGRSFNVGKINGVDVIYVMTGEQMVNAALTAQALLQAFNIKGVVHYGIGGATNASLTIGDVAVLSSVAFTSSWKWLEVGSQEKSEKEMRFGDFNLPKQGENRLAKIHFTPAQLYTNTKPMQELLWYSVDPHWYHIANQVEGLNLQRCVNQSLCAPTQPKVVYGLKGSTADMFVANGAYASFLYKELSVSIADEESAAVILTALSNSVPCIVFRGVSDVAGAEKLSISGLSALAAINAFKVAVEFIQLLTKNHTTV